MEFCSLDDPLSVVRHIHNLLLWALKRWPFCRNKLSIWCKIAWHSCDHLDGSFLFDQEHLGQFAKLEWVAAVGEFPISNLKFCREYGGERLGLAHSQYLSDKRYCNWGPQNWCICATMISARLCQSSVLIWLTREIAQVAQLFERAL